MAPFTSCLFNFSAISPLRTSREHIDPSKCGYNLETNPFLSPPLCAREKARPRHCAGKGSRRSGLHASSQQLRVNSSLKEISGNEGKKASWCSRARAPEKEAVTEGPGLARGPLLLLIEPPGEMQKLRGLRHLTPVEPAVVAAAGTIHRGVSMHYLPARKEQRRAGRARDIAVRWPQLGWSESVRRATQCAWTSLSLALRFFFFGYLRLSLFPVGDQSEIVIFVGHQGARVRLSGCGMDFFPMGGEKWEACFQFLRSV